ncbi:hypothetical protein [Aureimonas leprariae]|uniref:Uncharacterized protein n=1 Tax=Plantimonas leprariae TaxID=2615207 RepID=A0A7V7PN14_9HYPH|nr:hypothetical protein [Aureimonas leprariae]KAB0678863.1 hypothetical protein F6X38_15405 [Aureimonas leprariae]
MPPAPIAAAPVETPAVAAQPPAAQPGAPAEPDQQAQAGQLPDACFAYPAKLQPAEIEEFLAKPDELLTRYGGGGVALSNRVRSLAGSDGRTLDPLLRLAAAAKPDEKAMIGAGLGRAAFACSRTSPAYAAMIQSMIASRSSPELLTAFLSATNDIQTAAIGAGASAGASGAGGGGLAGGGLAGPFSAGLGGDEVVPTTAPAYSGVSRSIVLLDGDDDDDNGSVSPANSD